jgi:putative phosphoesterase
MTRIGLISDTHGWLDEAVFKHFEQCDQIWHGGDFGDLQIAEQLAAFRPLKGVYGNIDGHDIRSFYPLVQTWKCEQLQVYMTHVGGYPNRYAPGVKQALVEKEAGLFISGHSHILKVIYDDKIACLHMNPGAAGRHGWHTVRTVLRFSIDGKNIKDCEVIELGKRSAPANKG